jgi:hypothetical protein
VSKPSGQADQATKLRNSGYGAFMAAMLLVVTGCVCTEGSDVPIGLRR